ncbi:thioesterase [Solihabitans fulvus]|uniref:Thioesterase n=1 Tax=Solihabitans fulvus TaxID=1892852 RepID=A0A5B2XSE9_9PSEU|nr:thioesterase family protein [Solihabitans fulvus]KAA2265814.1 thioesterase [Solihabitans fulvus]
MRAVEDRITTSRQRPRHASANIRTWIGFRQFMSLVEEAVLCWFRESGYGPQELYHRYGLGLEIIDSSVLLPATLEIDDEVDAEVGWVAPGRFRVRLSVVRDGRPVTALRGRVSVALVVERDDAVPAALPPALVSLIVPNVRAAADPVGPPRGEGPFNWFWRMRYFHCHYSDRVQHGTYVQALEEVVDRFLASRGLAVPRLLDERGWIPVVSRARVRLLADAHMGDHMRTTFVVGDIVGDRAFDGRMDCYTLGSGDQRHVATATILHGYAISGGVGAGTLARLDPATIEALTRGRQ